jgi:hypothetical protein
VPDCIAAGQKCAELLCKCIQRQFPGPGTPPVLGEVGPQSSPAVKCAAEILAEQAQAPQKIDAIRYLGRIGCTKCYPCVEEGLVAALDDCVEEVRFEAAKAIRSTATERCCCCKYTSCCTQKVFEKLYKVAYGTRDDGCPIEPSPRVRRMARQALQMCGGPIAGEPETPTPTEGPTAPPPPLPAPAPPAGAPPADGAAPPPVAAAAATPPPAATANSAPQAPVAAQPAPQTKVAEQAPHQHGAAAVAPSAAPSTPPAAQPVSEARKSPLTNTSAGPRFLRINSAPSDSAPPIIALPPNSPSRPANESIR